MGFLDDAKKFIDENDDKVDQAQDMAQEKMGDGDTTA
jgi:hypothetical protein